MSRDLGARLTPLLLERLRGDDLQARAGEAVLIATPDAEGSPQLALLSYGEVVAASDRSLHLATYRGSRTTANLRRSSDLTLCLVADGAAYYIKGSARERPAPQALHGLVIFEVEVLHVLEDREQGMPLTSGITFVCDGGEEVLLKRWQPVVTALRALRGTST